jgi:hypothetical protein
LIATTSRLDRRLVKSQVAIKNAFIEIRKNLEEGNIPIGSVESLNF